MAHLGIQFNDIHSYYDWNMVVEPFEVPPALPKTTYIDIPGGDGSIDLSDVHGEVKYNDRDCKFTFVMLPDDSDTWEEKKTIISNALNGKTVKITLDKDEEYYLEGRATVNEYLSEKAYKRIVVTARVKPYKYKQNKTTAFFELSATPQTVALTNGRKPVVPEITCTDDNTIIVFENGTYNLSAGTHKALDIRFTKDINTLTLSGSGTITFEYQEADL